MRRADRLFEILQILRRRQLTRARDLAERLEVSERTIYRDIRDLMASGVPVEGEAGVGYLLREGFDLPPLMFNEAEVEALVLGARIVESWADRDLAEAARDVLVKVEAVLPDRLKQQLDETALWAPADHFRVPISFDPKVLRIALRRKQKLTFQYRNAEDEESRRKVRPLGLSFYGHIWLLSAWCELREDFRAFRLDRIEGLEVLEETFVPERGKTIDDYLKREREKDRDRHAA